MADEKQVREFLTETKERADDILGQEHTGADVKRVILDLMQVVQNFDNLMINSVGASADSRVMKKRYEQEKTANKQAHEELEVVRALLLSMVEEVKTIGGEINNLLKTLPTDAANPSVLSAQRIRSANIKIAETIAKSKK